MNRGLFFFSAILALTLGVATPAGAAVHHVGKTVGVVMPPDSRDCIFFQLVGVGEADPVVPGSPWIAVPSSHFGFKQIYALLLFAKGAGIPITVETSSQSLSSCGGMVGVWQVYTAS